MSEENIKKEEEGVLKKEDVVEIFEKFFNKDIKDSKDSKENDKKEEPIITPSEKEINICVESNFKIVENLKKIVGNEKEIDEFINSETFSSFTPKEKNSFLKFKFYKTVGSNKEIINNLTNLASLGSETAKAKLDALKNIDEKTEFNCRDNILAQNLDFIYDDVLMNFNKEMTNVDKKNLLGFTTQQEVTPKKLIQNLENGLINIEEFETSKKAWISANPKSKFLNIS